MDMAEEAHHDARNMLATSSDLPGTRDIENVCTKVPGAANDKLVEGWVRFQPHVRLDCLSTALRTAAEPGSAEDLH
jgi:hypothetical protein